MKVAVISKADACGGGASRVAAELVQLLNDRGYVAHHWASWAGSGFKPNMRPLCGKHFSKLKVLHYGTRKLGFTELMPYELPFLLKNGRIWDYDLIHFHDLSSAISPLTLRYLSRKKPVIWTFHDCSPFTGGCLYPMGCEKYRTRCGRCVQAGTWPIDSWFDFTGFMQGVKRGLAKTGRIVPITPSRWMADTAYSSGMFDYPPVVVPNGVDTVVFKPYPKSSMKMKLGLPQDRTVILVSAGGLLDERKGTRFALDALSQLKDFRPYLLLVGAGGEDVKRLISEFDYTETGYIIDSERLAEAYAAADLFLFCSLADNQPLSILETMATATPMIGFKTGGIPDMVVQNETGYLVEQRDITALVDVLRRALSSPEILVRWGEQACHRAESVYAYNQFIDNHLALYERVLRGEFDVWRRQ